MKLIVLFLYSFSVFAQLDVKLSFLENPFLLPENVAGFNVTNIAKDTEALSLKYTKKLKKKKVLGFSVINKLILNTLLFDIDLNKNKSMYNLKNRDKVNDSIKDFGLSLSSLAYKKIAKKTVLFLNAEAKYSDGYSLEYDLSSPSSKTFDYYLISKKNLNFKLGSGVQTRLHKKIRLDASYKFSLSDYFYDYSIYEINKGQEEDNISHSLSSNLNFKLNKRINVDLKSFNVYKIYKNKLALKENGYVVVQGFAEPEKLLDISGGTSFTLKLTKKTKVSLLTTKLVRKDQVSKARDVVIDSYKALFESKSKSKLKLKTSFEYKKLDYKNQIASLVSESDTRLRTIETRSFVLGIVFSGLSLNFTNINTNSTRDYDNINYNKYDLGYTVAF